MPAESNTTPLPPAPAWWKVALEMRAPIEFAAGLSAFPLLAMSPRGVTASRDTRSRTTAADTSGRMMKSMKACAPFGLGASAGMAMASMNRGTRSRGKAPSCAMHWSMSRRAGAPRRLSRPPSSGSIASTTAKESTSEMASRASAACSSTSSSTTRSETPRRTRLKTKPVSPRSPSMLRRLISATSSTHKLGTSTHKRARRVSITGGPMSRYKYLRRCLVNLLILYLGIISAACFFGAVTIYLAAVEYEHALQGPEAVAESIAIAGATAAWVSAVFGVLTIGSIIFRNFDNPQPEASQGSGGDGALRKRFHRNASRTLESGEAPGAMGRGAHDKTRTLPAVPESVDIEASMVSRSRPHMAHDMSMKFAMGEGHGGFVMRPDDQPAQLSADLRTAPRSAAQARADR